MDMREIKFRAWFPDLGVMLTDKIWVHNDGDLGVTTEAFEESLPKWFEIDYDQDCVIKNAGEVHHVMSLLIGDEFLQFDKKQFNLMQFTGLLDVNGKEIYDGDIVEAAGFVHARYVIEWNEYLAAWFPRLLDLDKFKCTYGTTFKDSIKYDEVIGNIYENPDLL